MIAAFDVVEMVPQRHERREVDGAVDQSVLHSACSSSSDAGPCVSIGTPLLSVVSDPQLITEYFAHRRSPRIKTALRRSELLGINRGCVDGNHFIQLV